MAPSSNISGQDPAVQWLTSRERILEWAQLLFAHRGYDGSSTVAVAREAHTSESQIMKHFGGKAGLLAAVLERGWAAIIPALSGRADQGPAANAQNMFSTLLNEGDPLLVDSC